MKWMISAAACLLVAQQAAAQALPDGDTPTITGPVTLRHMSAAAGESRTFVLDMPAGRTLRVEAEGSGGLPGIRLVDLTNPLLAPCRKEPSRERVSVCTLLDTGFQPHSYSVTLTASPNEGYDDVNVHMSGSSQLAQSGVAYSDMEAGGFTQPFIVRLNRPGPLSVSTWGGVGDLQLQVTHVDKRFKDNPVCYSQTPGTSHECHLAQAAAEGYYWIYARGLSKGATLRVDYRD
jgi:hypothetical protein